MKISYNWLQDYFEKPIPSVEKISELLTMHAFEVESVEKVGKDTVLDVKVLPDRSHDCLSHRGIALEVGLLANIPVKSDIRTLPTLSVPESNVLKIEVEDTKLCRRFSALVIENVEVKESPKWLVERLEAIGQRSINNIVDATNYVMFSLGQPLHAYDRALLKESGGGWKIVARKAKGGEMLLALDNKEYTLAEGQLVIVDGNSDVVLGIAGVKGGKASEISKHTKDIVLEAANFESVNIRQTARALGLRTDASIRFENEITPELTAWSLKAVSDIIFKIASTDEIQAEGMVDVYPRRANLYKVGVSVSEIQNVLGMSVSQKEVEEIWNRRGFEWKLVEPRVEIVEVAKSLVGVPYKFGASVLFDSPKAFDCSSFTAYAYTCAGIAIPRICDEQYHFGQEVTESEALPGDLVFFKSNRTDISPESIGHNGIYIGNGEMVQAGGVDIGYAQVVKEKIVESKYFSTGFKGYRRLIVNEDKRFVVTIPSERLDLRIKEDLIEEIARILGYENLVSKPISQWPGNVEIERKTYYANLVRKFFVESGYFEVITYAFQKKGEVELANPIAKDRPYLRANLADGLSESLVLNSHNAGLLGLAEVKIFEIGNVFTKDREYTALAFTGGDVEDTQKKIADAFGTTPNFTKSGNILETSLEDAIKKLPEPSEALTFEKNIDVRFKSFSQFPFVLRDIALWAPNADESKSQLETIFQTRGGKLLQKITLFDQFQKGDQTSLAYHLVFQSFEKTLTDVEVNEIMNKIASDITKQGWQVR